jgi:hypothetical protein
LVVVALVGVAAADGNWQLKGERWPGVMCGDAGQQGSLRECEAPGDEEEEEEGDPTSEMNGVRRIAGTCRACQRAMREVFDLLAALAISTKFPIGSTLPIKPVNRRCEST